MGEYDRTSRRDLGDLVQRARRVEPVYSVRPVADQDDVEPVLRGAAGRDRFIRALEADRLVSKSRKHFLLSQQSPPIVFDDKQSLPAPTGCGSAAAASSSTAAGNYASNRLPWPSLLSALIAP
jgi:hypothetical protein